MQALALVSFVTVLFAAHLEPHNRASTTVDDIENSSRIPFLFEPHEFTLSCRELNHRCIHEAKGLMVLKNECYRSLDNEDIQHHLWKRRNKSKHLLTGYHLCQYYTCRTFAEECKLHAKGRYIATLTCEHHYDHSRGLRYLMDMQCVYKDACSHRKEQCQQNKAGWDVKINECQETHKVDPYNATYIEYIEQCEYSEPMPWQFDDDLLEYWEDFDVFDYTEKLMIHQDEYNIKMKNLNELHAKFQKHQSSH
eukprot:233633_1